MARGTSLAGPNKFVGWGICTAAFPWVFFIIQCIEQVFISVRNAHDIKSTIVSSFSGSFSSLKGSMSGELSVVLALLTVEGILMAAASGFKGVKFRPWSKVRGESLLTITSEYQKRWSAYMVIAVLGSSSGVVLFCGVVILFSNHGLLFALIMICLAAMHVVVNVFLVSLEAGDLNEFAPYVLYCKLFQRVVDVKAAGPLNRRDSPTAVPVLAYALAVLALLLLPVVPLIGVIAVEWAELREEYRWVFVVWVFGPEVVLACVALFVARSYWGGCHWSADYSDSASKRVAVLLIEWVLFGGVALFMVLSLLIYHDAGVSGLSMILFALSVMCSIVVAFMAASRSGVIWRRGLMNKLWSQIYHMAGQQFVQGRSDLFKMDGGASLDSANKELLRMYSAKDRAELSVIAKQIINWGYDGSNSVG